MVNNVIYPVLRRTMRGLKERLIPHNINYRPFGLNTTKQGISKYEVHPAFQSALPFSESLYNKCGDYIVTPRVVNVPPASVIIAEGGRIYATRQYIAVIDQDNALIPETSYHHVGINKLGNPEDNPVFKTTFFINPQKYKGTVFSMLSGGGAADNYGHWLIDAIPRLGLLKQSGLFSEVDWFIVPTYRHEYHKSSLSLLDIPPEKIIDAGKALHIHADRVISTTTPRHIGHFPTWAGEFLRQSYHQAIRPEKYPPLVYVRRSDSLIRRILNEDEIVASIKPYGFVDYELSRLSFPEKVNLFRSAKVVASATGAGLSNIVFCQPGAKVLEIFHSKFMSTMFADIALRVGLDYHYIIKEDGKKHKSLREGVKVHYTLNVNQVKNKIADML